MTRNMHQKITCQAQVLTQTTAGEQQESFSDIATIWAEVMAKSGDMTLSARQKYVSPGYRLRMRYQDKLLATRKILWQGQAYRVTSLRNPDNRKRILEIEMVEDRP